MIDWNSYRKLFPVLIEKTYLDHAALAPLSTKVANISNVVIRDYTLNGILKWQKWDNSVQQTRLLASKLLNCEPEELAFTLSTTDSILFVVEGLDWKKEDNIVSIEKEFVANYYPWASLAREGVELRLAHQNEGRIDINEIESLIDDRTRLVAISWVQFISGFKIDLKALADICHKNNVLLAVDTIQGLGALKLDVKETGIDFLCSGAQKWMLGPIGTGIFYCKKEHIAKLKLRRFGWTSVETPFDFSNLSQPLKTTARRFEYSDTNQIGIVGLGESLKLLLEIPREEIEKRVFALTDLLVDGLLKKGIVPISSRKMNEKSGIVSFSLGEKTKDTYDKLMAKNVVVSLREGMIRISPHFYNNEEDIERCLSFL